MDGETKNSAVSSIWKMYKPSSVAQKLMQYDDRVLGEVERQTCKKMVLHRFQLKFHNVGI
jgi:isoaspartyl peptidase/L-asparaginase-like protein (Ntn-hydrolase superfamily)